MGEIERIASLYIKTILVIIQRFIVTGFLPGRKRQKNRRIVGDAGRSVI